MIGQPEPTEDTPEKLLATAEGALDRFLGLDFKANQSRAGVDNLSQSRQFSVLQVIALAYFLDSFLSIQAVHIPVFLLPVAHPPFQHWPTRQRTARLPQSFGRLSPPAYPRSSRIETPER